MKKNYCLMLLVISIIAFITSCKNENQINSPVEELRSFEYAGKTYHEIRIGSQIWLKEYLDVGVMIKGSQHQTNNGIIEKYYYNDDSVNYAKYGAFYEWDEAMQYSRNEGEKGICPVGYHIPTKAEYETLKSFVNNNANLLLEIGQGEGNNYTGFNLKYSGCLTMSREFQYLNQGAMVWTSTEYDLFNAYNLGCSISITGLAINDWCYKTNCLSIRCIKD